MKDGMVFYRSWFEAMEEIPAEDFKAAVLAMAKLGLDGEESEPEGLARAIFRMARPTIEKNNQRYENGIRGGRKPNQTITKPEPNRNQTVTKPEPTENRIQNTENRIQNTENRIQNNNNISLVPTEPGRHGDPVPYQAVIDYLNQVCGTKYHATTAKTRECIRARWREGARLDDFKRVIDRKARDWLNTDRAEYLRPETLFGEKFEGYLNAPESKPKKKAIQFNTFHQRDQNYEEIQKALLVKQMEG